MRKMIRLSMLVFSEHIKMYFLLLIQILMILFGINILLASYQQQAMLEEPFAQVLQQEGFYLHEYGLSSDTCVSSQLHGEKEIIYFPFYTCNAEYDNLQCATTIVVYDDTFWNSYQPPMKRGKWELPNSYDADAFCIATANCPSSKITIPEIGAALNVSGILGNLTYIPLMNSWSRNGGLSDNLYYTFDTAKEEIVYLLMPQTQWEKLGIPTNELSLGEHCIVVFTSLSEEDRQLNEKILVQNANPAIALSTLQDRAERARMETIQRYVPLLIALFFITIFGTMCAMAIHALQDLHTYAIFYLCGMKWKTCIFIHTLQVCLLLMLSLGICSIIYFVMQLTGHIAVLGLRFTVDNLLVSILFCSIVLLLNGLIPYFMISSRMPITLIRSAKT